MEKAYQFKVALKYRKALWRRIEIKGDQTLTDFDQIIRYAFDHDTFDHLSEFFKGRWPHGGYGDIYPDGQGDGAKKRIKQLELSKGDKLGYIYDFGDEIHHTVTLEKIEKPEKEIEYPRIISKNKPRYRYCKTCKKEGKQTIATWICIECTGEEGKRVLLCEDCIDKEHEDHYADEILY